MDFPIFIIWMSPFLKVFRSIRGIFFYFIFFDEIHVQANRKTLVGTPRFAHSVCLCPVNRTPGLYGLIILQAIFDNSSYRAVSLYIHCN